MIAPLKSVYFEDDGDAVDPTQLRPKPQYESNFAALTVLIQIAGRPRGRRPAGLANREPIVRPTIDPTVLDEMIAATEGLSKKYTPAMLNFGLLAVAPYWRMIDAIKSSRSW